MKELNEERLTVFLDSLLEKGIPSVDCIVYEDHKQIYRHMNGTVDMGKTVKVQPDQRYLMFSMTKVQTMTAVMQLIEQEKISMDDEVGKYLPAYNKLMVNDEEGLRELEEPLKIWHLLSILTILLRRLSPSDLSAVSSRCIFRRSLSPMSTTPSPSSPSNCWIAGCIL